MDKREYTKPFLTFDQQADLLIERGLCSSREDICHYLRQVNYYRLCGYWHPFYQRDEKGICLQQFREGTTIEKIWRQYTFDRQFRVLMMDAIERVEISLRTKFAYYTAKAYGAFAYANRSTYRENPHTPPLRADAPTRERRKYENRCKKNNFDLRHSQILRRLNSQFRLSLEKSAKHFNRNYTNPYPPIWIATEFMTFNMVASLIEMSEKSIIKQIADDYLLPKPVFLSWLQGINEIRNICAHHSRLWNRTLGVQFKIPKYKKTPELRKMMEVHPSNKMFFGTIVLRLLLGNIAPQSKWQDRWEALLAQ